MTVSELLKLIPKEKCTTLSIVFDDEHGKRKHVDGLAQAFENAQKKSILEREIKYMYVDYNMLIVRVKNHGA